MRRPIASESRVAGRVPSEERGLKHDASKPVPNSRRWTELPPGVDPHDRQKTANLHRPLRRDIIDETGLQFGPGHMPELTGAIGNRSEALQQHKKPWQRAQPRVKSIRHSPG